MPISSAISRTAPVPPGASVMIQVDISGEESKGGVDPARVHDLADHVASLDLELVGVMGIALLAEPEAARPGFRQLRGLADEFGLPVRFVGVGEGIQALRDFDAGEFIDAIFGGP